MRTHKKHGVLLAGVNGFKIYMFNVNTLRVVARYQHKDVIDQTSKDWDIVMNYVNLKFQSAARKEKIVSDFLDFTQGLI